MSETLPLELEARILWKTGRLLKFLKWPSAHEVDFGEFLVEFDFKQGLIVTRYPDGRVIEIGSFLSLQKPGKSITSIAGQICVGDDYFIELHPATDEKSAFIHCATSLIDGWEYDLQLDTSNGEWVIADRVSLVSVVEGRDAFLKVLYTKENIPLAVVLASLIAFLRFSH
ncbi:MAG: hypothetical protein ACI9FG_001444 [Crocinitomicaceae bacterium]|jgi:hypothetical protein